MTLRYITARFGQLLLIVFLAVSVNFAIPRLIPGDPIESALATKMAMTGTEAGDIAAIAAAYRAKFGLDQPLWRQYLNYWGDILRGDLGVSLVSFPQTVWSKIRDALPWTLGLLVTSTLIAFAVGSLMGAFLAWPKAPSWLKAFVPPLMLLSAVPYYLLAVILVFLFALTWPLLPASGGFSPISVPGYDWRSALDILSHSLLPGLSIALGGIGFWALGMRALMVSVLGEDYITFAEAKGLPARRIFFRYAMRNAILPQVTALALAMGFVLSGSVLVEVVFSYPGLGKLLFGAIAGKDYFAIQGIVLFLILTLAGALFAVDLVYPLIDPRIKYGE